MTASQLLVLACNLIINGVTQGVLIALPALALTLVMGVNRFPNAATGDFLTLGAYAAVLSQTIAKLPIFLAALIAAVVTGLLSAGSYLVIFRRLAKQTMVSSLLASIGLGYLVRSLITFFAGSDQRSLDVPLLRAWNFGGVRILPNDVAASAVALVCLVAVFILLYKTRFGRQLRAVADSPELARSSGIRANELMLKLWLLVGALSGISGVLLGAQSVVAPEMGWDQLISAFTAMVLGGIGNPLGAVAGALLLAVIQELSVPLLGPSYKLVLAFFVLAFVLLLRPAGLFGRIEAVR